MPFPDIDPIIFQIGPFAIRWYALAYIAGLMLAWRYCLVLTDRTPGTMTRLQLDDFLVWATIGVVIGGRLGYVTFYQPGYFLAHPGPKSRVLLVPGDGLSMTGGSNR